MQVQVKTALDETSKKGEFVRTDSGYRFNIEEVQENDKGPWAHRTLIFKMLKGIPDEYLSVSIVHPVWQKTREDPNDPHRGWLFRNANDQPVSASNGYGSFSCEGSVHDDIFNSKSIRDIYDIHSKGEKLHNNKFTVPIFFDCIKQEIINNESSEIIRIINSKFNKVCQNPQLDLYPEDLQQKIEDVNKWIYSKINNGVYRCGFAQSQQAYEEAMKDLFEALDQAEQILQNQRYLTSNQILTEADIRLFVTLIRFDEVYVVYFKTNKKMIREYPNLRNFCRDIAQIQGVKTTINMNHIKTHYYASHNILNAYAIIPVGNNSLEDLYLTHDRNRF